MNKESIYLEYQEHELEVAFCRSCCKGSREILIGDGRCINCFEKQEFNEKMKINTNQT